MEKLGEYFCISDFKYRALFEFFISLFNYNM